MYYIISDDDWDDATVSYNDWDDAAVSYNYKIIEIQYKSETNLSESHMGWLGYLNHTRTVCTSMQMVTLPSK